jgi:hypothetical protein
MRAHPVCGADNGLYERHLIFDNVLDIGKVAQENALKQSRVPSGIFSRSAGC